MTYYTDSGTMSDIKTHLRTTIPANDAWSLVESTTFATSAYAADVYKCDHTTSGASADFYVMVSLGATANSLYLGIAEGYNTSTHKPIRPAMMATSTAVTLQTDGGILAADTELDWYEGTSGGMSVAAVRVGGSSSAAPYYLCVAKDGVWISGNSSSIPGGYVGVYRTELGATDDPLPLIVMGSTATGLWKAYSTRHPRRGGLSTAYAGNLNGGNGGDGGMVATPSTNIPGSWTPLAGPGSTDANAFDAYTQSDPGASKIAVLNSYGTSAGQGRVVNGWLRGWLAHARYTPLGPVRGDTVTIDGKTYLYPATSGGIWVEMDPA